MDNTVFKGIVYKRRSVSAIGKGNRGQGKSTDVEISDDTKLMALKDQTMRRAAASKSRADESITKANRPRSNAKNMEAGEGAEPKSVKAKIMGRYSLAKMSKSSDRDKISRGEDVAEVKILNDTEQNVKAPAKQKTGADREIIQAYLSSSERNLSRFRPRKEVPAFRMVDLGESDSHRIVGKRIKVYWSGSRRWFTGHIQAFERRKKVHRILYEDGDKEELDLKNERFVLEILPSERFNLRAELKLQREVAASDGPKVSADTLKEEVDDAGNVTKRFETTKKNASKKTTKEDRSELKRKYSEVQKGEEPVSETDVDILPKTFEKELTDELLAAKEPVEVMCGKAHDGSKGAAEIAKEAIGVLEAQTGRLELHAEFVTVGLVNGDGCSGRSGQTMKDDSCGEVANKPVKKQISRRKTKTTFSTAKRRRHKLLNRRVSQKQEKLVAEMEAGAHLHEANLNSMYGDVHVKKDVEDNHQIESNKTEACADDESEDNNMLSLKAQGTLPHLDAENINGLEDVRCSGDADDEVDKLKKKEVTSKDAAANLEIAVLIAGTIKEKVKSREVNVEVPGDVTSGKNDDETLQWREGSGRLPPDLQPTAAKIPEEQNLGILWRKLNAGKGKSDRDKEVALVRQKIVATMQEQKQQQC